MKLTFKAGVFRAWTFRAGAFTGVGVDQTVPPTPTPTPSPGGGGGGSLGYSYRPKRKPKPEEPEVIEYWAFDYTVPCQRLRVVSHGGVIVGDVAPYVRVFGKSGGTAKIKAGAATIASVDVGMVRKSCGVADVVTEKRRIKRLRIRALREERALMAALSRGVPLGDAIQEMVRT